MLQRAQARAILADQHRRLVVEDALIGVGLDEFPYPQAARIAARPLGRQGVVGAYDLVAVRDAGARAEEQRAIVGQAAEKPVRILRHDLDMLRADAVRLLRHLLVVVAQNELAIIAPRDTGDRRGIETCEHFLYGRGQLGGNLPAAGDADRGRSRSVLGLAEQVYGDQFGVHRVVADHHGLGRAGEKIDADAPVRLPLGLRHVGVAEADEHVHRLDGLGADRGHRLHTPMA